MEIKSLCLTHQLKGAFKGLWLVMFILMLPQIALGQEKIAFSSNRDDPGNFFTSEIYVMNPDGTNQIRLTNSPGRDFFPSYSPDGSRIVFASERDTGFPQIYVMNADGTNQLRLTNNVAADSHPSFSPDGSRIVFESNLDDFNNFEICVMNADGTNRTCLSNSSATDSTPSFSPDGSKIVFVSDRDGHSQIYLMNADGSHQTRLTNNSAFDSGPAFSPDGSRIAFSSNRDNGNTDEIYVMNADGSNQTRLTFDNNSSANARNPSFRRDGSKIAFASDRDSIFPQIFVMNPDGTDQIQLTNSSAVEAAPSWGGQVDGLPNAPPNAPSDLTATAISASQIDLEWTDNSNNESGFAIERCRNKSCNNFVQIAQVGANVTTFADTGLLANTHYYYRVRAFNSIGNSAYSNTASTKTLR